jgi:hypothetical protein
MSMHDPPHWFCRAVARDKSDIKLPSFRQFTIANPLTNSAKEFVPPPSDDVGARDRVLNSAKAAANRTCINPRGDNNESIP